MDDKGSKEVVLKSKFHIGKNGMIYLLEYTHNYHVDFRLLKHEDLVYMITFEQLRAIMPNSIKSKLQTYVDPLNQAMREFDINTRLRVCAFIAQCAHESGSLVYTHEIASGVEYEGREDLGNTCIGDGKKFKGRGPLQVTGRYNYELCGKALGLDLISKPELLELPEYGFKGSAWLWKHKGLNEIADTGDIVKVSERVNGGHNGLQSRIDFYKKALEVIK